MHLLYVDESGQHGGDYFVLAGVAVFERQTHWIGEEIDRVQKELFPHLTDVSLEFHASEIRGSRKEPWSLLGPPNAEPRRDLLDRIYHVIVESQLTIFGVAIQREWWAHQEDSDEYLFAFENLVSRFDAYLKRLYRETGEPNRGLIVIADSEWRKRIESLAVKIRREGTRWGQLRNLAEIPLFTLAENSRLLQMADFVANATWGRYEKGYSLQFDRLVAKIDQVNRVYHGLAHFCAHHLTCPCPACLSRRDKVS